MDVDLRGGSNDRIHCGVGWSLSDFAARGTHDWSTDLPLSALSGLDPRDLGASATRPIRFAVVREAGRLAVHLNALGSVHGRGPAALVGRRARRARARLHPPLIA